MFFERPFMIISFSSRHRAQFRFPFLPADVCLTMAQLIENCRFCFFRFQTCLDNSVSCLYFSLRRDFKWFLYLVLKSLAVSQRWQFPNTHKLYSIFNRHTVRISYSCTGNMKSFLDKHNKIILKKHTNRLNKDDEKLCNCRQRVNCPTDGKCLTRSVVYKAEVTSTDNNTTQTFIGVTANDFKTRYRNHLKSLYATKSTSTKLSYPNTSGT